MGPNRAISFNSATTLIETHNLQDLAKMSNAELANAYAALILADDGVEITVSPAAQPLAPKD
jgi:hypothetical protein